MEKRGKIRSKQWVKGWNKECGLKDLDRWAEKIYPKTVYYHYRCVLLELIQKTCCRLNETNWSEHCFRGHPTLVFPVYVHTKACLEIHPTSANFGSTDVYIRETLSFKLKISNSSWMSWCFIPSFSRLISNTWRPSTEILFPLLQLSFVGLLLRSNIQNHIPERIAWM